MLIRAGNRIGHIPRVVGSVGLEETTQPPGILTWASLVYFNRTQDTDFLAEAYAAYSANNRWYYTEPGYATSTGLSTWCCEDTGWDTSPRWDNGTVEAIDLNGWLHIDQLLLAHMGEILKKPSAEVTAWKVKAKQTAAAVTARLWDPAAGVFWDRLPNKSADHATISNTITNTRSDSVFVKVVTPATFWSLFSAIATPKQAESQVATFLVRMSLAARQTNTRRLASILRPHRPRCCGTGAGQASHSFPHAMRRGERTTVSSDKLLARSYLDKRELAGSFGLRLLW